MAFTSYHQAKKYIAFSTLSDLENGRKAPQTSAPRFFSSHPFFSLHRKEMPQSLITQKLRANESFTRYFSQTMFPQTSAKRNKDVSTFSTFPILQNSLKYPSPRMPRLFHDEKLSDFHLKRFESICKDKHAEMQQSEQPTNSAASLPEQIPEALFPFRAHKRRKQALKSCDGKVRSGC